MATSGPPWRSIEAIPPATQRQRSPRLAALAKQWLTEREVLREQGEEQRLVAHMKNRMAIETGIIEGLYTLEQGVTETLIEQGFDATLLPSSETNRDPKLVISLLKDQRYAIDCIFDLVKRDRPLSTSVIKELHVLLTEHQTTTTAVDQFGNLIEVPLLRGEWKHIPNNPTRPDGTVHAYCPPEHVASEMDRLLDLYRQYEAISVAPEVLAAWLHHRFTQIHPFQDGNGRIARLLASIVFIRAQWLPLVVERDDRANYIKTLEQADAGDLGPLVTLFASLLTRSFIRALSDVHVVEQQVAEHLDDVLAAIRDQVQAGREGAGTLDDLRSLLLRTASGICEEYAERIQTGLRPVFPEIRTRAKVSDAENAQAYRSPRIDLAKHAKFFADFTRASGWSRIMIRRQPDPSTAAETLLVSCTAIGRSVGSVGVTCGLIIPDPETNRAQTRPVSEEPFVATVEELAGDQMQADLTSRFEEWLRHSLLIGMTQWRNELT